MNFYNTYIFIENIQQVATIIILNQKLEIRIKAKKKQKKRKEYQNTRIFYPILVAILFTITPVKYQQGIDFSMGQYDSICCKLHQDNGYQTNDRRVSKNFFLLQSKQTIGRGIVFLEEHVMNTCRAVEKFTACLATIAKLHDYKEASVCVSKSKVQLLILPFHDRLRSVTRPRKQQVESKGGHQYLFQLHLSLDLTILSYLQLLIVNCWWMNREFCRSKKIVSRLIFYGYFVSFFIYEIIFFNLFIKDIIHSFLLYYFVHVFVYF